MPSTVTIDATNLADPQLALENYLQHFTTAIAFDFRTKDMEVSEYLTMKYYVRGYMHT